MSSEGIELNNSEDAKKPEVHIPWGMRYIQYLDAKWVSTGKARYAVASNVGFKPHFNFYGVNPTELSEEQQEHDPVILLHGNYTNQSTWFSLAKKLSQEYKGPVFTLNLDNGVYTQRDVDAIEAKITTIKGLYGDVDVATHLVGFSGGASLAYHMSIDQQDWQVNTAGNLTQYRDGRDTSVIHYRHDIGRVIMMASGQVPHGYSTNHAVSDKFGFIRAKTDFLWEGDLDMQADHKAVVDAGHIGLLHKSDAGNHVCLWLNEVSQFSRSTDRQHEELVVARSR